MDEAETPRRQLAVRTITGACQSLSECRVRDELPLEKPGTAPGKRSQGAWTDAVHDDRFVWPEARPESSYLRSWEEAGRLRSWGSKEWTNRGPQDRSAAGAKAYP